MDDTGIEWTLHGLVDSTDGHLVSRARRRYCRIIDSTANELWNRSCLLPDGHPNSKSHVRYLNGLRHAYGVALQEPDDRSIVLDWYVV